MSNKHAQRVEEGVYHYKGFKIEKEYLGYIAWSITSLKTDYKSDHTNTKWEAMETIDYYEEKGYV